MKALRRSRHEADALFALVALEINISRFPAA